MKNTNDKQVAYTLAGILLLVLIGFATLNQGPLYQGNLRFSAEENTSSMIQMMVPTHQLRLGSIPFLKMGLSTQGTLQVKKFSININLKDTRVSDIRLLRNGQDVTGLLTAESQKTLKEGLDAQNRGMIKTLDLTFATPLRGDQLQDVYSFYFNVDTLSDQSIVRSSLINIVLQDQNEERIVSGSEEYTELEVTYEKE